MRVPASVLDTGCKAGQSLRTNLLFVGTCRISTNIRCPSDPFKFTLEDLRPAPHNQMGVRKVRKTQKGWLEKELEDRKSKLHPVD